MAIQQTLACLSDSLTKLRSRPECFYFFYKKLVELRFPLDVAEVLDLRYLLNQAIDASEATNATPDYRHFREARENEFDALGIEKKRDRDRLLKLLALIREFHYVHSVASRDTEKALRKALADNEKAAAQSRRYGRIALLVALTTAAVWLGFSEPGWPVKIVAAAGTYLSVDYFYSLSILKREQTLLGQRLDDVLSRRVKALNWKRLSRNIALTLGYAKISGVEAFLLEREAETEDAYRYYM
jgi:hypothetical protein